MRPGELLRTAAAVPLWCVAATGYAWWLTLYAPFIAADELSKLIRGRRL